MSPWNDPAYPLERPFIVANQTHKCTHPSHTRQAYQDALRWGADFIDVGIVLTRDRVAICVDGPVMQDETDVETRFPARARPDGNWYWTDFDLAEIKTLEKHGSDDSEPNRSAQPYLPYRVATLQELIDTVQAEHYRRTIRRQYTLGHTPGPVGIMPTLLDHGSEAAAALSTQLHSNRYTLPELERLCIIHSADLTTIEYLATQTEMRLLWNTKANPTDEQLDSLRPGDGIAVHRQLIEDDAGNTTPLVQRARVRGIAVFAYAFQDEQDAIERFFHVHRVDGVFTNSPDAARSAKGLRVIR
ncbi:MAG: glycerophosphodiester phosphodiesterase family protein [Planctomycetota bacterium]